MKAADYPIEILYDGSCGVCSSEMTTYARKNPGNRFVFIDISRPEFRPEPYGRSLKELMKALYVRDRSGRLFVGVEAFSAIWRAFPRGSWFRLLDRLVTLPVVMPLAKIAYRLFARYRHVFDRGGTPRSCPR